MKKVNVAEVVDEIIAETAPVIDDEMYMMVKKDGQILMEHRLSRFITQDGNLSLGLMSKQMFDIPMIFQSIYEVKVILPEQTITKYAVYLSYNYVVFSSTIINENGAKETSLDCSDNGLLFRIVG